MAAKTYFISFILILINTQIFAKSFGQAEQQQLLEWTQENESNLIEQYPIVHSKWFEKACLDLTKVLQFKEIVTCQLFDSKQINAYVFNNGHVYFSTALMKLIRNKHQWASILAHENAHIELQHYLKTVRKINHPGFFFPKKRIKKLLKKHEKEADDWSEKQLKKMGFYPRQIGFFLKRVQNNKNIKTKNQHLKISKRIHKSTFDEIIDEDLIKQINSL